MSTLIKSVFQKVGTSKLPFAMLMVVLLPLISNAQQQVFTVDHNGTTTVFTNLDSAIAGAQTGDPINLPGGIINFSGNIRKGVNLVGAGFHPDSTVATSQTIIVPAVSIKNGANNFSVSGVFFQSNMSIDSCSNVLVSRCRIGGTFTTTKSQSIVLNGCVTDAVSIGTGSSTISVYNSLLYNSIDCISGSASFYNNVIFKPYHSNYTNYLFFSGSYTVTNCYFANNIMRLSGATNVAGYNYYYNNIFTDTVYISGANSLFQNCKFNRALNTLLQGSATNTAVYTTTDNFHLLTSGAAVGAGIGGTDCGIYGGNTPWKEGAVPYNPHIQSATIPGVTDQNGNLNVVFKVKAQDN